MLPSRSLSCSTSVTSYSSQKAFVDYVSLDVRTSKIFLASSYDFQPECLELLIMGT